MAETTPSTGQPETNSAAAGEKKPEVEINLQALAREIMILLKKELRLDIERQGGRQ